MKAKGLLLNLVIVGMTLGTAWAVRGQFGHEQGAAWAGSLGAICILLIANKQEWYNHAFKIVLAAAVGWGIGGMMSYGRVVGFGRGIDFVNVYYGLTMLFVIGGLYGFLGGGLFGLALTNPEKNKVKWHLVIVEMVVWALLTYFFLVAQWEWLMTPPRSELWAACLGMGIALTWYLIRKKHYSALRVALFSSLGAGFGFSFGNFLQVMGNVSGIDFNFWNVMEYSLGFFGGLGMAYGTFTSKWKSLELSQNKSIQLIPILMLVLFIPFVVWDQSFTTENLSNTFEGIVTGNTTVLVIAIQAGVLLLIFCYTLYILIKFYYLKDQKPYLLEGRGVKQWFIIHFGIYILLSLLITGALASTYRIEQYLYILNFALILFLLPKLTTVFDEKRINCGKMSRLFLLVLAIMAVLALIAINSHVEMGGMQKRFEF